MRALAACLQITRRHARADCHTHYKYVCTNAHLTHVPTFLRTKCVNLFTSKLFTGVYICHGALAAVKEGVVRRCVRKGSLIDKKFFSS